MIQGGDPTGTGTGGSSYWKKAFADEIWKGFDGRGLLAMANNGKNTNGSQFFITFTKCPHLDDRHTIFGRLVKGDDVLKRMEHVETDGDRPVDKIVILKGKVLVDSFDLLLNEDKYKQELRESRDSKRLKLEMLKKRAMQTTKSTDDVGKFMKKQKSNFQII